MLEFNRAELPDDLVQESYNGNWLNSITNNYISPSNAYKFNKPRRNIVVIGSVPGAYQNQILPLIGYYPVSDYVVEALLFGSLDRVTWMNLGTKTITGAQPNDTYVFYYNGIPPCTHFYVMWGTTQSAPPFYLIPLVIKIEGSGKP